MYFYPLFKLREYFFILLFRYQTETHFGGGGGGYHRFRADSGETAGDAVDFKSRTCPNAGQHRLVRLAGQRSRTHTGFKELFFRKRQVLPTRNFGGVGQNPQVRALSRGVVAEMA